MQENFTVSFFYTGSSFRKILCFFTGDTVHQNKCFRTVQVKFVLDVLLVTMPLIYTRFLSRWHSRFFPLSFEYDYSFELSKNTVFINPLCTLNNFFFSFPWSSKLAIDEHDGRLRLPDNRGKFQPREDNHQSPRSLHLVRKSVTARYTFSLFSEVFSSSSYSLLRTFFSAATPELLYL